MKNILKITTFLIAASLSTAAIAHTAGPKNADKAYLDQALSKLPQDDADQFRDTMKEAHEKNQAISDQIHNLHDQLDTIITTEPFDQDAFRATSKQLRDVYETMRANTDDAFATAIAALPQDERKMIADAMAYPHEKHTAKMAQ